MKYISARDIKAVADEPYLVDGLIPARSVVLVSAPSNGGKTAILVHVATALAESRMACSMFTTRNPDLRPVLYVNGELSARDFHLYAHAAARGFGLKHASERILLPGDGGRGCVNLGDGQLDRFDDLLAIVEEERPSLIVLDTLRALFSIDENDQQKVGVVGKSLAWIAERHDCAVLIAHHTRKPTQYASTAQTAVSGSGYVVGMVDAHLALRAREGRFAHRLEIAKDRRSTTGGLREYAITAGLSNGVSSISLAHAIGKPDKEARALSFLRDRGPMLQSAILKEGIVGRRIFAKWRECGQVRQLEDNRWIAA